MKQKLFIPQHHAGYQPVIYRLMNYSNIATINNLLYGYYICVI
jgi:hypothetical protein